MCTLMAGWVLVVSLLFSPGMLPADRPSHLYLNLMPLCFGCSMISMKGPAAWTWLCGVIPHPYTAVGDNNKKRKVKRLFVKILEQLVVLHSKYIEHRIHW